MQQFKRLSVQDAQPLIAAGDAIVIDIRDPDSFKQGRINGSSHLENAGIPDFVQNHEYDDTIIVCCYHGNMSQAAAQFLVQQGFDDVYSLDGGFTEWAQVYPQQVDSGG